MSETSGTDDHPYRSYMDDPDIKWRSGKPDYSLADKKYMAERSRHHKAGSLEKLVENLVKTWEMESTHKTDLKDWGTIDREKFRFIVNGLPPLNAEDNVRLGNYNMLLRECLLFDVDSKTNESSHAIFKAAFPEGFAWELLELTSGPPTVTFTWRHWANWIGPYMDKQPTGEMLEMYGACVVTVNDDLKIKDLCVYYDPHPMLLKFFGGRKNCPFAIKD